MQNNETPTIDTTLLNDKTIELWDMIEAKMGVVMLQGRAGVAKSATCKFIADNVRYNGKPLKFIDLRLSQMDETHFGFPYRKESDKYDFEVMNFALPKFFNEAMREPVLINFEELNRCSQDVQNAALEILNERTLHGNKLPDHVFMIATGNMGDEDGCNVQQFDNALINRLIMVDFELSYQEWCEYYANENVMTHVVDFINDNTDLHYYSKKDYLDNNEGLPFASPRSWTNLSKSAVYFQDSHSELIDFVSENAKGFVGEYSATAFVGWLKDLRNVTFDKIVSGGLHTRYFDEKQLIKSLKDIKKQISKGDLSVNNLTKTQKTRVEKMFADFNV
jgi:hypothetical protein